MREMMLDRSAQPIRNMFERPIPTETSPWTYRGSTQARTYFPSGGPMNAPYVQQALTADTDTWWRITLPTYVLPAADVAVPFSIDVNPSLTRLVTIIARWRRGSDGYTRENSVGFSDVPGNTWTRIAAGLKPDPVYGPFTEVIFEVNVSSGVTGETLKATRAMIGESNSNGSHGPISPAPSYYDGDSLEWRWMGTPRLSSSAGYPTNIDAIARAFPVVELRDKTSVTTVDVGGSFTSYTIFSVWSNTSNNAVPAGGEFFGKIQDAIDNGGIRFLIGNGTVWTANILRGSAQSEKKLAIMSVTPGAALVATHANSSVTNNATGPMTPYVGAFSADGRPGNVEPVNGITYLSGFLPVALTVGQIVHLRDVLAKTYGMTIAA